MNKNKNYVRGRAFEYKIATFMRRKGYFVIRAAGSHGVSDLVAMKKGEKPLLIQCKTGVTQGLTADEHNALLNTAISSGGVPILAFKPEKGPIVFFVLIGISRKRGENEKEIKFK
jgi:Holliday junction resolvase